MTTSVELQSIALDEQGRPVIAGTPYKVRFLAMDHVIQRLSAEQIHAEHPELTLTQVYAALAYYYEHKNVMNAEFAESAEEYEQMWQADQDSPIRSKLRQMGKIP